MSKEKKSAKDIAFEKERVKFRQQIRSLTSALEEKRAEIETCNETIREKDEIIQKQQEWIDRLLEYTEMSEEDMKKILEDKKQRAEICERISATLRFFGNTRGFLE